MKDIYRETWTERKSRQSEVTQGPKYKHHMFSVYEDPSFYSLA